MKGFWRKMHNEERHDDLKVKEVAMGVTYRFTKPGRCSQHELNML
jgi:hypothetical protein